MDFYKYYLKKYNDADSAEEFDIDPENMERVLLELYIQHQVEDGLDEDADEHRADALKRLSMYEERFRLLQKLDDDMIRRQENAIRTDEDFYEYVRLLDRRDANAERRARYHEIGRGKFPLNSEWMKDTAQNSRGKLITSTAQGPEGSLISSMTARMRSANMSLTR